jgi:hypothetical protein
MNYPIGVDEIAHRSNKWRTACRNEAIRVDIRNEALCVNHAPPRPGGSAQGVKVSRLGRLRNANEHLGSVAEGNWVEQIEAAASHASANGNALASDLFGLCHAADRIRLAHAQQPAGLASGIRIGHNPRLSMMASKPL